MQQKFIGIDFGGTYVRISEVDPSTGTLIGKLFTEKLDDIVSNEQLTDLISSHIPDKSNVGISAAGNVDEKELIIKQSPNSRIRKVITFGQSLREKGHDVKMTNDMRAAVQAAAQYGEGKNYDSVLLASFGTGFNVAAVKDGRNVTTAEFSHQIYKKDGDLFCGCGGKGHLEVYVSGVGAATMAKQYLEINPSIDHHIVKLSLQEYNQVRKIKSKKELSSENLSRPEVYAMIVHKITAKHVYKALLQKPNQDPQMTIKNTQVAAIADSFGRMISVYNPIDILVVMGGHTQNWEVLFEPAIEMYRKGNFQMPSLKKPKIVKTQLPEIGVQGAVAYFVRQRE